MIPIKNEIISNIIRFPIRNCRFTKCILCLAPLNNNMWAHDECCGSLSNLSIEYIQANCGCYNKTGIEVNMERIKVR